MIYWGVRKLLSRLASSRLMVLSAVAGTLYVWLFTPLSVATVVGAATRYGLAVVACLSRLPEAAATVREERTRTEAERDAFRQFAQLVAATDPVEPRLEWPSAPPRQADRGAVAVSTDGSGPVPSNDSLQEVRDAYRETVMATAHYEEEYAESLGENMATEFGPEIARAVTDGGAVTPQLRERLLECSLQAGRERARFLQRLEEERESVADARRVLRDVHERVERVEESLHRRSVRELVESWRRLEEADETRTAVLTERQSRLHAMADRRPSLSLQAYLYADQPWTFPVLNDGLDSGNRIRRAKSRVIDTLCER